jgi:hypothetical protein
LRGVYRVAAGCLPGRNRAGAGRKPRRYLPEPGICAAAHGPGCEADISLRWSLPAEVESKFRFWGNASGRGAGEGAGSGSRKDAKTRRRRASPVAERLFSQAWGRRRGIRRSGLRVGRAPTLCAFASSCEPSYEGTVTVTVPALPTCSASYPSLPGARRPISDTSPCYVTLA